MSLGQAFPVRASIPDLYEVRGKWTGGGAAADMTNPDADWSRGIESVKYNAATGKYKVKFVDVGQQLVDASANVLRDDSGDDPIFAVVIWDSLDLVAKTIEVEFGGAAILADIATDTKVCFHFVWARQSPTGAIV